VEQLPESPNNPVDYSPPTFTPIDPVFRTTEESYNREFIDYLGLDPVETRTLEDGITIAQEIEEATGVRPAFVYIGFVPPESALRDVVPVPQDTDELELVVVTAEGGLVRRRLAGVTRAEVMEVAREFRNEVTNPRNVRTTSYLPSSQQLYEWFVAPVVDDLLVLEINNLVFLPEAGLRSLPYAALHNGEAFLIEQFSVGLMPSLSLTDTRYVDVRNAEILAMGIAESTQGQTPLPSVPLEVDTLASKLWKGRVFLNEASTIENLRQAREIQPFGIIHLATHADFVPGGIGESYIQLWDERIQLDQIRELGFNDPPVELLVLSACRTALGNEQAELGFAGLAVQSGVKSAVASLWYVSDAATAALMTQFYEQLLDAPIKAEALRQAQLAMARGEVFVDENGQLQGLEQIDPLSLPASSAQEVLGQTLDHPYYWAAFTMIGNPW
jgi:CHAT domain-containing protein